MNQQIAGDLVGGLLVPTPHALRVWSCVYRAAEGRLLPFREDHVARVLAAYACNNGGEEDILVIVELTPALAPLRYGFAAGRCDVDGWTNSGHCRGLVDVDLTNLLGRLTHGERCRLIVGSA